MIARPSQESTHWGRKLLLSTWLVALSVAYTAWQYLGNPSSAVAFAPLPPNGSSPQATSAPVVAGQVVAVPRKGVPATSAGTSVPKPTGPAPTPAPAPAPTPTPTPAPAPAPAPAPKPAGQYVDGTYAGTTENAYYGLVQVQAVVQNGAIANVTFLQYPSDRSTSRDINSQAMPLLVQEAIQAQNANVNIVSGATFTSQAFQKSLTAALAQAKV